MKLKQTETDLIGEWEFDSNSIAEDATTKRITELVRHHLQKIATDSSGWDVLYRDPQDGGYWELTFPESDLHGGGPPRLAAVSSEYVKSKYDDV